MQVQLALCHLLVAAMRQERYRHETAVGYSGVLFGWQALLAWGRKGKSHAQSSKQGPTLVACCLLPVHKHT